MTQRSGFSDVDSSADPSRLITFLDGTAAILSEVKHRMRASLELGPGDRFLDIGCGVGHDVADDDRGVGVDLSLAMLTEAKRRWADVRVAAADAQSLPLADRSFLGCRIERVLMHVANPAAVLGEAHRVLKASGRIALWEPDFESLLFDATDVEVSRAVAIAAGKRVAQGRIGRELGRLMLDAGFVDVDVALEPGGGRSLDDVRRIFGFDYVLAELVQSGRIEETRLQAWVDELQERERSGTLWVYFSRFFATGRRLT